MTAVRAASRADVFFHAPVIIRSATMVPRNTTVFFAGMSGFANPWHLATIPGDKRISTACYGSGKRALESLGCWFESCGPQMP